MPPFPENKQVHPTEETPKTLSPQEIKLHQVISQLNKVVIETFTHHPTLTKKDKAEHIHPLMHSILQLQQEGVKLSLETGEVVLNHALNSLSKHKVTGHDHILGDEITALRQLLPVSGTRIVR